LIPAAWENKEKERWRTYSELLKGESTSQANLKVVAAGGAVNYRAESTGNRTGKDGLGLGLPGLASAELAGRLVKPSTHTFVPILSEVIVDDHVVVLYHGEETGTVPWRMRGT
jgi:hypothetical protein